MEVKKFPQTLTVARIGASPTLAPNDWSRVISD